MSDNNVVSLYHVPQFYLKDQDMACNTWSIDTLFLNLLTPENYLCTGCHLITKHQLIEKSDKRKMFPQPEVILICKKAANFLITYLNVLKK